MHHQYKMYVIDFCLPAVKATLGTTTSSATTVTLKGTVIILAKKVAGAQQQSESNRAITAWAFPGIILYYFYIPHFGFLKHKHENLIIYATLRQIVRLNEQHQLTHSQTSYMQFLESRDSAWRWYYIIQRQPGKRSCARLWSHRSLRVSMIYGGAE